MSDGFPAELSRILNDMRRDIEALKTQARTVTATPVGKASSAFFLPDVAVPATPTGGVRIYSSSGVFYVKEVSGTIWQFKGPASDVSTAVATSGSASNPPTQAQVNAIRTDVYGIVDKLNDLIVSLRNGDVIA